MDKPDKLKLSEIDICDLFITPAIKQAGWDQLKQIRREVTLTPGPVVVRGNLSSRNKKKRKFADYVLSWQPGMPLAIVEAKDNTHSVSAGLQQALGYAEILDLPSAYPRAREVEGPEGGRGQARYHPAQDVAGCRHCLERGGLVADLGELPSALYCQLQPMPVLA